MKTIAEGYRYLNEAFSETHKVFPAGATIYEAGQPANRLYIVRHGTVRVTNESIAEGVRAGGIFGGETAYRTSYLASARTMRNTRVGLILRSELQLLNKAHSEVGLALLGMAMGERQNQVKAAPFIGDLTGTDIQILQQAAAGLERKDMRIKIPNGVDSNQYYSEKTLFNLTTKLFDKIDTFEMTQAVFTAYENGFIDGEVAVKDTDLLHVKKLSPTKRHLLHLFTLNGGEFSSTYSLAQALNVEENTVRARFRDIISKLGAGNRIHAGMMYLVARDTGLLADVQ